LGQGGGGRQADGLYKVSAFHIVGLSKDDCVGAR
jgi:hypothetical protein